MNANLKNKTLLTFFVGLLFSILGLITFLSYIGSPLAIPVWLNIIYSTLIVKICLIIGGLLLFIDSFSLARAGRRLTPIITGLVLAAIGAFPLAIDYGIWGYFGITLNFTIPPAILSAILACIGVYLVYTSYKLYILAKLR